ncbi:MAG: hypothetical protein JNN07_22375 [Verrucomicrobiales bacterium]|nr:hypothetical protein [Verrucomicrobiales bacterium]
MEDQHHFSLLQLSSRDPFMILYLTLALLMKKYADLGSAQEKFHRRPNIFGGAKTTAAVCDLLA